MTNASGNKSGVLRRGVLLGGTAGLAALAYYGWPQVQRLFVGDFQFQPLAEPTGFRRLGAGDVSQGMNPFFGLDGVGNRQAQEARAAIRADLCGSLFGEAAATGTVPVASFSDYNCPFCRVLTQRLAEIEAASGGGVRIAWHEWPLLGQVSEMSARAALAAKRQGAYVNFHKTLMRSRFVPTPAYLRQLAERLQIDPDRMLADMESSDVTNEIARSTALAGLFVFPGTPALVVGRTVVAGAIDVPVLQALIERERRDGPIPACSKA